MTRHMNTVGQEGKLRGSFKAQQHERGICLGEGHGTYIYTGPLSVGKQAGFKEWSGHEYPEVPLNPRHNTRACQILSAFQYPTPKCLLGFARM